jgi:GDPmannose 4,6-dehydratase
MSSPTEMVRVLRNIGPTEIYNFAAFTSGSGMYDDPVSTCDVNGLAVVRVLEAIREVDPNIRFCQASSREVFGLATESPQTEATLRNPRSPYGAAKAFADAMIQIYRQRYGMFASSAILYNHESPLRALSFVTRKITHGAVLVKLGMSKQLDLGDLDVRRDWGYAADYVNAMWLMLQQSQADDYVICSEESYAVRDFCEVAFTYLGLDYRKYVREDKSSYRPAEPVTLVGCSKKARSELGWIPQIGFRELVEKMVDVDLKSMCRKS